MGQNVNKSGGDWSSNVTSDAGAAANAVLYTSVDVSKYNYHVIQNNDAVGSIDFEASVDGVTFKPIYVADQTGANSDALTATLAPSKIGIIRGKFKAIKVLQVAAGAISAGNVLIAHGTE